MVEIGLDMYLENHVYISGWGHSSSEEQKAYEALLTLTEMQEFATDSSPGAYVHINIAYWRKANAIHGWFVNNVQDGKDECQESYVTRDQILELRQACTEALHAYNHGDKERCMELLPPTPGFFFGAYDLDDYYKQDLKDTIEQLDRVLKIPDKKWSVHYRASW